MTDDMLDPRSLYNIYRRDRSDGYGGVCIFISKRFKSIVIHLDYNRYTDVELIACRIILSGLTIDPS